MATNEWEYDQGSDVGSEPDYMEEVVPDLIKRIISPTRISERLNALEQLHDIAGIEWLEDLPTVILKNAKLMKTFEDILKRPNAKKLEFVNWTIAILALCFTNDGKFNRTTCEGIPILMARILKRFTSEVVLLGSDWNHSTLSLHSDILENAVAILESLASRVSQVDGLSELIAATDAVKWLIKLLRVKDVSSSIQERIYSILTDSTSIMDAEDVKAVMEFSNALLSNPGTTDLYKPFGLLKKLALTYPLAVITTGPQDGMKFAEKDELGWNPEDSVFDENSMDVTEEGAQVLSELDGEEKTDGAGESAATGTTQASADGKEPVEGADEDEEAEEMVLEDDDEDITSTVMEFYGVTNAPSCGLLGQLLWYACQAPTAVIKPKALVNSDAIEILKVLLSKSRDAPIKEAIISENVIKALHGRFKERPELRNELVIQAIDSFVKVSEDVTLCLDEGIVQSIIEAFGTYSTEGMTHHMTRHSTISFVGSCLTLATPEDFTRIINAQGLLNVFAQGLLSANQAHQTNMALSAEKVFNSFDKPSGNAATEFISTNMQEAIAKLKSRGMTHQGFTAFNERLVRAQVAAGQN